MKAFENYGHNRNLVKEYPLGISKRRSFFTLYRCFNTKEIFNNNQRLLMKKEKIKEQNSAVLHYFITLCSLRSQP